MDVADLQPSPASEKVSTSEQRKALEELAALLASDDTRARRFMAAHRSAVAAKLGDTICTELEKLIDGFDYRGALALMKNSQ